MSNDIHGTGIMAGMTHIEIDEFMSQAFKDILWDLAGSEYFDKVLHLQWLTHRAIMYAHSAGLYSALVRRGKND